VTSLVPAWAPNVHPMFVHFPIALLFTSVLLDLIAYSLPGRARVLLRNVGSVLGVIGAFAALATYLTGRAAAQTVLIPGKAHAHVNAHWEWAFWTLWYFAGLAVVRVVMLVTGRASSPRATAALAITGLIGLGLLFETADRGAELVYGQGVGVGVIPNTPR
jgi:uncharacterized membrane protein